MLKRLKTLLKGPLPSAEQIAEEKGRIDLDALEKALTHAQQRRAALLLDGSTEEILTAERKIDEARIELERAQVALAELERRRAEAEAAERRQELERRHAEVQAKVDAVVERIEREYPDAAATI